MDIEDVRNLRKKGDDWLIIFVTSGIGGLLNAIAGIKNTCWQNQEIGIKITFILSTVLILLGFIIRHSFNLRAKEIEKNWC